MIKKILQKYDMGLNLDKTERLLLAESGQILFNKLKSSDIFRVSKIYDRLFAFRKNLTFFEIL